MMDSVSHQRLVNSLAEIITALVSQRYAAKLYGQIVQGATARELKMDDALAEAKAEVLEIIESQARVLRGETEPSNDDGT